MKKIGDFLVVVISVFISIVCIHIIYNDDNVLKKEVIDSINNYILDIGEYARNISINFDKSGTLKLKAMYKGAHGESNPSDFEYKFSLKNNLLILDDDKGYVDFHLGKIIDVINTFAGLKTFVPELIESQKKDKSVIDYKIDSKLINDIYGTDFNDIDIKVYTRGFIKKIEKYEIMFDDIKVSVNNKKIVIDGNDLITLTFGNTGYSLNINDKLKMNVINYYQYNILLNDTSLFLEFTDKGFYLSALTSHAIYNSLELNGTYEDVDLNEEISSNRLENPLYRYFSEVDFNIWSKS